MPRLLKVMASQRVRKNAPVLNSKFVRIFSALLFCAHSKAINLCVKTRQGERFIPHIFYTMGAK